MVINDNGGTKIASDFSFKVNDGVAVAFDADGQNEINESSGTYTITEPAVAGYTANLDSCSGVSISVGQTKTCTITNNDVAPTPTPAPVPTPAPTPTPVPAGGGGGGGGGGGNGGRGIPPLLSVTASADVNGLITPAGSNAVNAGNSLTFSITPNTGFQIAGVLIDGSPVTPVTTYTFNNINSNHTISASFSGVAGAQTTSTQSAPTPPASNNPGGKSSSGKAENSGAAAQESPTPPEPPAGNLDQATTPPPTAALGESTGAKSFLSWIMSNWPWWLLLIILLIIVYYLYKRWQQEQKKNRP